MQGVQQRPLHVAYLAGATERDKKLAAMQVMCPAGKREGGVTCRAIEY